MDVKMLVTGVDWLVTRCRDGWINSQAYKKAVSSKWLSQSIAIQNRTRVGCCGQVNDLVD